MNLYLRYLIAVAPFLFSACAPINNEVEAPVARIEATTLEIHGDARVDNYYWLNDRDNQEVIDYLEAENAYTEEKLAHVADLREGLFNEIVARIKPDDSTPPYRSRSYFYYTRYEEGSEFPIYCRKRGSLEAPEEIILDASVLAADFDYFEIGDLAISENEQILAYTFDNVGRRIYTIRFVDLESGSTLDDEIQEVTGNIAWARDDKTLFYSKQNLETLRWDRILRHELGTSSEADVLVYEEEDPEFYVEVRMSKSRQYLFIESEQTLSSETRFLSSSDPTGTFETIAERKADHLYNVYHVGDRFVIRTNDEAQNFRLMEVPIRNPSMANWSEIIGHRPDVLLADVEVFDDYAVITERQNASIQMHIRSWDGGTDQYLDFGESAYLAESSTNKEIDSEVFRYTYESMTTPRSVYDYNFETRESTLIWEKPVLGGFNRNNYVTERVFARARDGQMVPVSIVYRNGFTKTGNAPLLLYAYGAYGISEDPYFSSSTVSLLDRGFVFAIAHVRGGEELGRAWYEDGKLLNKMNTFNDFIDVAEFLVAEGYGDSKRLFAEGGSAGGLLVGAVLNLRPDLFLGVVAAVPFVDVVTTMLDDTIPLTTSEYDEWGNPNDSTYYGYMLSYSPYDNVEAREYPNILVTSGLHDSQVQYWEPAKWVAKLRAMKTDNNLLLLHTNMDAGHGGESGRFRRYRETALIYAFLLDLAGISS